MSPQLRRITLAATKIIFAFAAASVSFRGFGPSACEAAPAARTVTPAESLTQRVGPVAQRILSLRIISPNDARSASRRASGVVVGTRGDRTTIVSSVYGLDEEPASIVITSAGQERRLATLIALDRTYGLALLEAPRLAVDEPSDLLIGESDGVSPKVGAVAIALGRSLGRLTVSRGVVSARRAQGTLLQTDAKLSPLNYGGLLVSRGDAPPYGLIVPRDVGPMSAAALYDSGVGFAVVWLTVLERVAKMREHGDLEPGRLGLSLAGSDPLREPAVVEAVEPAGAAAAAGLQPGDRIVSLEGRPITAFLLSRRTALLDAGDRVRLGLARDGSRSEVVIVLGR
ncbi:MAG: PDZ domain-containing protein [Planctomycetota bacterium]